MREMDLTLGLDHHSFMLGSVTLIDNGFKTNCREDYQGGLFAAANPNIKYENYQKSGPPIMSIVRILMVKSG